MKGASFDNFLKGFLKLLPVSLLQESVKKIDKDIIVEPLSRMQRLTKQAFAEKLIEREKLVKIKYLFNNYLKI